MTPSPDDSNTLLQVGYATWFGLIGQIIGSVFFGVYVAISAIVIRVLVLKGHQSRPHQIALFMQLCLLVNATCAFFTFTSVLVLQIQIIFTPSDSSSLQERIAILDESAILRRFRHMNEWACTLNFLIGDTLVIWRAWAIWHVSKWMQRIWIALAICNAVSMFLSLTVWKDGGLDKNLSLKTAFENNINLLLSLILNILATVAIAYKAWVVSTNSMFGQVRHYSGTQVQKTLWLMVDSGAVFCVLQGVYFGMLISGSQSKEASDNSTHFEKYAMIISPLSAMVIPLYPTTVFVLSNLIIRVQ